MIVVGAMVEKERKRHSIYKGVVASVRGRANPDNVSAFSDLQGEGRFSRVSWGTTNSYIGSLLTTKSTDIGEFCAPISYNSYQSFLLGRI